MSFLLGLSQMVHRCLDGLWNFCEPISGLYISVFLLHDYAYATQCMPRKEADALMKKLLKEAGMSSAKAYTIYFAVRIFGRKTL